MGEQPSLFDYWPGRGRRQPTLQERFLAFHHANPHVYEELLKLARRWQRAGNRHCGIKMLFEVLRYRHGLRTSGDDFKLNNNFHARYARLLVEKNPELADLFEMRELKAA